MIRLSARSLILGVGCAGLVGLAMTNLRISPPTLVSSTYAQQAATAESARENLIAHADELSRAFREVAKAVKPSVVSITATRKVAQRRINPRIPGQSRQAIPEEFRRFFGDDLFEQIPGQELPEGGSEGGVQEVPAGLGSGVIVSADGYIVTNNHVVADADGLKVGLSDGRELRVEKVVGTDAKSDLAVIKVNATGLVPASFGDSDALEVGDWVVAIGSPFGLAQTVTQGIVSAKNRADMQITSYDDFIQTDAAINPGNSGGPLLNLRGEVIGINTAIASRSGSYNGIGFAIPSSKARREVESLIRVGRVVRGFLGLELRDINEELESSEKIPADQDGVYVFSVAKGGPAEKAGLKSKDIILSVDGRSVNSVTALRNLIASTSPGTKVNLSVLRGGSKENLTAVVDEQTDQKLLAMQGGVSIPGLKVQPLTPELAAEFELPEDAKGLVITGLASNSPLSGLLSLGDLIQTVNGREVSSSEELAAEMLSAKVLRFGVLNAQGSKQIEVRVNR